EPDDEPVHGEIVRERSARPSVEDGRPDAGGLGRADQALPGLEGVGFEWHGPLPPPGILRGYDDVGEGFADRIVSMAEKALDVQSEVDLRDKKAEAFALTVATVGITFFPWLVVVAAIVLAALGYPVAALITGAAALVVAGPQIIRAIRKSDDDS
ncbi:MAG: hypothetical protein JWN84_1594, partial [Nocardioides sp.]|nr:hypothetical protein [Nocardioides sp.]